jgi:hypothetical protein
MIVGTVASAWFMGEGKNGRFLTGLDARFGMSSAD